MLRGAKELHGTTIHAQDGLVGRVDEILFDDNYWTVRYLIVDTGYWLAGRKVLLSPMSFGLPDWERQLLNVNLTREQIMNSPGVDTSKPVSRQWESEYYCYYCWPNYWAGTVSWDHSWYPGALLAESFVNAATVRQAPFKGTLSHTDSHLRSTRELDGYGISTTDGRLGHIEDFLVDDETWSIRYTAADARYVLPGKKVLLPPDRIGHANWRERTVTVGVSREQVSSAPEWDCDKPINSTFKEQIYRYYARQCQSSVDVSDARASAEKVCVV